MLLPIVWFGKWILKFSRRGFIWVQNKMFNFNIEIRGKFPKVIYKSLEGLR